MSLPNQIITILDSESGKEENLSTDGFLLLYLDEHAKIRMIGKMDIKVLAPILTKIALEKLSK